MDIHAAGELTCAPSCVKPESKSILLIHDVSCGPDKNTSGLRNVCQTWLGPSVRVVTAECVQTSHPVAAAAAHLYYSDDALPRPTASVPLSFPYPTDRRPASAPPPNLGRGGGWILQKNAFSLWIQTTVQTSLQQKDEWTSTHIIKALLLEPPSGFFSVGFGAKSKKWIFTRPLGTDGSVLLLLTATRLRRWLLAECVDRSHFLPSQLGTVISKRHGSPPSCLNDEFFGFRGVLTGQGVNRQPDNSRTPTQAKRRQSPLFFVARIKPIPWDIFPTEKYVRLSYSLFRTQLRKCRKLPLCVHLTRCSKWKAVDTWGFFLRRRGATGGLWIPKMGNSFRE